VSGGNELEVFWSFVNLLKEPKYLLIGFYDKSMDLLFFMEYIA